MPHQTIRRMTRKFLNREVVIRTAVTADLGSMTSLLGELFSIEADFTPDVRRQRQGLATLMASNNTTLLVAAAKETIIGMCTLQPLVSTAEGGTVGIIEDLVVTKMWRGKGVGGLLLNSIEEVARRQNMSRLQLLTEVDNNRAMQFYGKHRWEKLHLIAMRKRFS